VTAKAVLRTLDALLFYDGESLGIATL